MVLSALLWSPGKVTSLVGALRLVVYPSNPALSSLPHYFPALQSRRAHASLLPVIMPRCCLELEQDVCGHEVDLCYICVVKRNIDQSISNVT